MKKHTLHRLVLMLMAMSLAPGLAWSQGTAKSATADATTTEDEIVVLSPFNVDTTKDTGYKATNSTSGTRLNTKIKDLPLNLEVITNSFIRDTGGTNLREALRYSAGVVLESQSDAFTDPDVGKPQSAGANDPRGVTRAVGDSTVKLRGFVIDQVLRDGFRRQYSADWINIERVDVLRGPSALLYGVGSFGGVINYSPKRPDPAKETSYIGVTVGTNSLYRGEFDFNVPLGNSSWKPAFRLTGSYQDKGDYTQYYKENHWTLSPSLIFKPFENTEVFLDNEFGYQKQVGNGFQNIRNNIDNSNTGPSRNALWLTDVLDPVTSQKLSQKVDNRSFRWSGDDTYLKGPYRNNIIDITQRVGENLFIRVGAAESSATFDSRQVQGTSIMENAFASTPVASRGVALYGTVVTSPISGQTAHSAPSTKTNVAIRYKWTDDDKTELRDQVRADATYKLDLGFWGVHKFIVGLQYMRLKSTEDEFGPPYSYGSVFVPNYLQYSYKNPGDLTPFQYGVQGDGTPDNPRTHLYTTTLHTHDLGEFAVYQGQFWDDRITLIGGIRHDRSDAMSVKQYVYETTHSQDYNSRVGTSAPTATSPQVGLNFAVTKGISLFALYSTGVVPNYYDRDGNGNMMPTTKAKNYEAGVKFDLADGRISGTISAYKITREGQPHFVWWAPSPYESLRKGYDPTKPATQVAWYTTPDAFYEGIHNTPNRTVAQQTALAKTIWPSYFWPLIDEIATAPNKAAAWNNGPQSSTFWNWIAGAEPNTGNPTYTGNFYFPLINYSIPDVAAFEGAATGAAGWAGNYYYTAGTPYRYGDGTTGYGNAPNGAGASVPMNDQARGWDMSLILRPVNELQIVANFAHVDRKITTQTYHFVNSIYWPTAPWYTSDNAYGTLDSSKVGKDVYTVLTDSSTYNQTVPEYGQSGDDTPRNTASLWVRYSLEKLGDPLKGWAVAAGGNWEDKRMWFTGFTGGGGNVTYMSGTRQLLKIYTKERYTFTTMVEYSFRFAKKYDTRIALNVDNILNDQEVYGLVYAPGTSGKFSVSVRY